ncbi:MAG: carboxylesterase family protein, partial [Bacteroidales bacterium]|nr:carboxylesterase family protein [Bacteroidales bacterium]MBN2666708.1 carboxylesterase family protein [Bacteroidales bacterium]
IMGQSGGGAKVCTLTAMPSAKGLFHKAVALSGNILKGGDKDNSEKLGSYILKEAGLTASQIDRLQEMAWRDYYAIANKASLRLMEESGVTDMMARLMAGFSPVADGFYLPREPFYSGELSSDIPMIICSTFYERSPSAFDSSIENITLDEAKNLIKATWGFIGPLGDNSSAIIDAYSMNFPDRKPIEILSLVLSNRKQVVATADAKVRQSAPVYLAWFGWNPPIFDGRLRAFHTMDIGFWYYNTDVQISHTGGGARPRKLAARMSEALVQFMRTGDPNCAYLPQWPKYTNANGETMILDDTCEVKNDPDREARKSLG